MQINGFTFPRGQSPSVARGSSSQTANTPYWYIHGHASESSYGHERVSPACRPGSVRPLARGGGHPSGTAVADSLVRPTREHRAGHPRSLAQETSGSPLGLAPGGVYRAAAVTCGAGGLLHHRFTLTSRMARRRSVLCGTVPRVTPGRRYRPPCPVEPGPSSPGLRPARPPGRLTHAPGYAESDHAVVADRNGQILCRPESMSPAARTVTSRGTKR